MTNNLDLNADIIDVRDIIARFEELESDLMDSYHEETKEETWVTVKSADDELFQKWLVAPDTDQLDIAQYLLLKDTLSDLKDCGGGDEQWRGDWYPVTLIADHHFQDYAEELAEDVCDMDADRSWPFNCIDWEKAARELRYDYTSVDIDGETYWTR